MKVLFDTNVLIGFFRNPATRNEFEARMSRPLSFLSSIVVLELYAGCRSARQESELARFVKPFEKANRLVTPDHNCFVETGRVLAKLADEGIGKAHRRQLVNDVLIAVTAARSGVYVVTANSQDFSRIEKYTSVKWILPEVDRRTLS